MLRHTVLSAALALGLAPAVQAQSPEVPLTIIVPYPAGGPLDTSAHILADGARAQLGDIKVENKPGAGGSTGADLVAKSGPGHNAW
ncbi:hypothetical protein ACFX58_18910 [Sphingomonas sp. NCPPB 2930]